MYFFGLVRARIMRARVRVHIAHRRGHKWEEVGTSEKVRGWIDASPLLQKTNLCKTNHKRQTSNVLTAEGCTLVVQGGDLV